MGLFTLWHSEVMTFEGDLKTFEFSRELERYSFPCILIKQKSLHTNRKRKGKKPDYTCNPDKKQESRVLSFAVNFSVFTEVLCARLA